MSPTVTFCSHSKCAKTKGNGFFVIYFFQESFAVINNNMTCKDASENPDLREEYTKLLGRLREIVMKLPTANRVTAARLIMHLKQVSDHSEANAMPGSNLAIVFGPTLLRPW